MKAVLFDLDGTLLTNNFDTLMKSYFEGISSLFIDWVKPEIFIKELMNATKAMITSNDSTRTNLEVFSDQFFPSTKLDPKLMKIFEQYYIDDFPKLAFLAEANPNAVDIVEAAFANNNKVVIATNPVFPLEPILERLRWAKVADYPYDLITNGEIMHFCKPNPNYYTEISEKIGISPEECLMIGDDPINDGTAATVGMDTFLLTEGNTLKDALEYMLAKRR